MNKHLESAKCRISKLGVVVALAITLIIIMLPIQSQARSSDRGRFTLRYRAVALNYPNFFNSEFDRLIVNGQLKPNNNPYSSENVTIILNLINKLRDDSNWSFIQSNEEIRTLFGYCFKELPQTTGDVIFPKSSVERFITPSDEKTKSGKYYLRDLILWCLYPTCAITGDRRFGRAPFATSEQIIEQIKKWQQKYPELIELPDSKPARKDIALAVAKISFWDKARETMLQDTAFHHWLEQYWEDYGWTINELGAIKLVAVAQILESTTEQQANQRRQVGNVLRFFLSGAGLNQKINPSS